MIVWLIVLALISNGLNLVIPILISKSIDSYSAGQFDWRTIVLEFLSATLLIFVFTYVQSIVQTYAS